MRPSQKKVEAILQIEPHTTRKQLRRFIGMVNYYRDMWPLRSQLLAPLSSLTSSKVKWKWTTEHQESFEKMEALIAKETLLTLPDFSKEFEIHTDASKLVRFLWWSHGQITVIGGSLVGHSAGHSNSLPRNEAMALALLYLL
jgi:hypothetical protein